MDTYKVGVTDTFIEEFRLEFETEVDRDIWYEEAVCRQQNGHYGIYKVTKGMHITYGDEVYAEENILYIVCENEEFLKLKKEMNSIGWKETK